MYATFVVGSMIPRLATLSTALSLALPLKICPTTLNVRYAA